MVESKAQAGLRLEHAKLVDFDKPERMVGAHRHGQRLTARSRNTIVDEPMGCDIKTCNHVFCQNGHPDVARWGHD